MTDIPSADPEQFKKRVERARTKYSKMRTTSPQQSRVQTSTSKVYVDGEFVSGIDIGIELYDREELDERLRIS